MYEVQYRCAQLYYFSTVVYSTRLVQLNGGSPVTLHTAVRAVLSINSESRGGEREMERAACGGSRGASLCNAEHCEQRKAQSEVRQIQIQILVPVWAAS